MAATIQNNAITLKGSTDMVAEFFGYGINSILYQRGIYPPENFKREGKYGLTLLVTDDEKLQEYIDNVLKQVKDWLFEKTVKKLVVVIMDIDTHETLERWQFDVECDKLVTETSKPKEKSLKQIQNEIRDMMRQITATVTFLPLLDEPCAFDILIYTDKDQDVPEKWEESGPQFIANSQEVKLRSFSTSIHKVEAMVAYKN